MDCRERGNDGYACRNKVVAGRRCRKHTKEWVEEAEKRYTGEWNTATIIDYIDCVLWVRDNER